MKIRDILIGAGSSALNFFAPGAGTLVHGLLNKYIFDEELPPADKLTGDDATRLITTKLSGEQQALILDRVVELEIQRSMERQAFDDNTVSIRGYEHKEIMGGKSPRPHAVREMVFLLKFQIVALILLTFILMGVNIYLTSQGKETMALTDVLPDLSLMGTIIFTPALVIIRYFSGRDNNKKVAAFEKLGGDPTQLLGVGSAIASRILKR